MKEDKEEVKLQEEVLHLLEKWVNDIAFAYIFGSLTSGKYVSGKSDIDIGIYFLEDYSFFEIIEMAGKIKSNISDHPEIDIVQLQKENVILNQQVITKGTLVLNNNPKKHTEFWLKQVSMYPDFKISRRLLEEGLIKPVIPK